MPFIKIDINQIIEKERASSDEFKKHWEGSRGRAKKRNNKIISLIKHLFRI